MPSGLELVGDLVESPIFPPHGGRVPRLREPKIACGRDSAHTGAHEREILLYHAREGVQRCPLYLDGWNRAAGVMFEDEEFGPALATIEPVAQALLDLLPAGVGQVCYGVLAHRPFFRLMHTYLLLLDAVGRHAQADRLAGRLYALWTMDNIGFRFLLTRQARAEAD